MRSGAGAAAAESKSPHCADTGNAAPTLAFASFRHGGGKCSKIKFSQLSLRAFVVALLTMRYNFNLGWGTN